MKTLARACLLAVTLASGCYAGEATYGGAIAVETPDLAVVAPGVQVIANYDEPIFYADGLYWWFYGDAWYWSHYYTGGWTYAAVPPRTILSIDRPHVYRHYRPVGYEPHRRPVPSHRVHRPVVRDHRPHRG